MLVFWFCRYAVDSRTDSGRYVIEPPELGAALVGMSISAGEGGTGSGGDDMASTSQPDEQPAREAVVAEVTGEASTRPRSDEKIDIHASDASLDDDESSSSSDDSDRDNLVRPPVRAWEEH